MKLLGTILSGMALAIGLLAPKLIAQNDSDLTSNQGAVDYELPPSTELTQLRFRVWKPEDPKGIVVLLTGYRNKVTDLTPEEADDQNNWSSYARDNQLGCVWISMAADEGKLNSGRGFYAANAGMGRVIQNGLKKSFPDDLPVYICARDSSASRCLLGVVNNNNNADFISAWCCLDGDNWPTSVDLSSESPGILALSTTSASYGDGSLFFKAARKAHKKWTWVSYLPKEKAQLRDFIQKYFLALAQSPPGQERSLDTKQEVFPTSENAGSMLCSWVPNDQLGALWATIHQSHEDRPMVIEKIADLSAEKLSNLVIDLRLPPHVQDASTVNGVIAYCTWEEDRKVLFGQQASKENELEGIPNQILKFAFDHNLAVLTWSTPGNFDNDVSTEDLPAEQQQAADREFELYATAWDRTVEGLCRDYKMPAGDYLLYGMSKGAQWAHRLVMHRPERFLAVCVHVNSSYDRPTEAASRCLWLVTTGELEFGYQSAKRFYKECRNLGYPILFKAGIGLGHSNREDMDKLRDLFFEYALNVRDERRSTYGPDYASQESTTPPPIPATFANPPYVGDFVNQDMYPITQVDLIPVGCRVPLPTKEIADAWNKYPLPAR